MKYAALTGIAAAILLILLCFMPWAFYPDLQESFTGFYSSHNHYGKPGKAFVFLCVLAVMFFLIPRVWAKWANQVCGVIIFAYALKTYILFSSCYNTICPEVKFALPAVLGTSLLILICTLLSKVKMIDS